MLVWWCWKPAASVSLEVGLRGHESWRAGLGWPSLGLWAFLLVLKFVALLGFVSLLGFLTLFPPAGLAAMF